jgi:NAD(P)-dependent dehydrogenase (short-subunit alcohol dehydrogenase family)
MLRDRVMVIVGGAGLLGRAFAAGVLEKGGVAVIADIDFARAEDVAATLDPMETGCAIARHVDITDHASIRRLISDTIDRHGKIDGVVITGYPRNRAYGRHLEDVTFADFCENLNLHLGGYFLVMQQFAKHFVAVGGGSIVNLGSVYGSIAPRFGVYDGTTMTMPVEYAAIKAGVLRLTTYFAQFYKKSGVRVNAVSPGGIFDDQPRGFVEKYAALSGVKGMLNPTDVVGTVCFLLSDLSCFVTGQNLIVDDGFSL